MDYESNVHEPNFNEPNLEEPNLVGQGLDTLDELREIESNLKKSYITMYLKAKDKYLVPKYILDELFETFGELVELHDKQIQNTIKHCMLTIDGTFSPIFYIAHFHFS